MKKVLIPLGVLYVFVSFFLATDLNPLLLWDPYREFVNWLFDAMFSLHRSLPLFWIMTLPAIAAILSHLIERGGAKTADQQHS